MRLFDGINVTLVSDARLAWRWVSMRAMMLDTAFLVSWATIPDDLKAALPSWLVPAMAVFVLIVGMVGRVLKQEKPDDKTS